MSATRFLLLWALNQFRNRFMHSPLTGYDFCRAAEDERGEDILLGDPAQRWMCEVDRDLAPRFEPEGCRAFVGAEAEQRVRRDDVAAAGAPPGDAFQLAQLLERVDADVRVGADADAD